MKKGCLFLLALWAVLGGVYYYYLQGTDLSEKYWIPILLGLSLVIVVSNILGLWMLINQKRASKRSPQEWREGDFVAVSGRVNALKEPLDAPFSGKKSVIVEYEIKRSVQNNESTSSVADFMGMLMVPCAVHTQRGPLRLVGFPMLAQVQGEMLGGADALLRAANYLAHTTFKDKPSNPLSMLKELGAALSDEDGDLKLDLKDPKVLLPEQEDFDDEDREDGEALQKQPEPDAALLASSPNTKESEEKIEQFASLLRDDAYSLHETVILNGAEVSVFGTFRESKKAIDIGSGIKNLKHQIHLGKVDAILGSQFRKTFIALIFWGAVCLAAHWYVAKYIGLEPEEMLKHLSELKARF